MPSDPTPEPITFRTGDYVSPGLRRIAPDACFPFMSVGDKARHSWKYLRREIPHNWYVDSRSPEIGFVSRDEAHKSRGSRATVRTCWAASGERVHAQAHFAPRVL